VDLGPQLPDQVPGLLGCRAAGRDGGAHAPTLSTTSMFDNLNL
jgi:hypothetical protein